MVCSGKHLLFFFFGVYDSTVYRLFLWILPFPAQVGDGVAHTGRI